MTFPSARVSIAPCGGWSPSFASASMWPAATSSSTGGSPMRSRTGFIRGAPEGESVTRARAISTDDAQACGGSTPSILMSWRGASSALGAPTTLGGLGRRPLLPAGELAPRGSSTDGARLGLSRALATGMWGHFMSCPTARLVAALKSGTGVRSPQAQRSTSALRTVEPAGGRPQAAIETNPADAASFARSPQRAQGASPPCASRVW